MRQELEDMLGASMSDSMMRDIAELASVMYDMFPFDDMASEYPFMGDESVTLDQAMRLMEQLQDMDRLDEQMESAMRRGGRKTLTWIAWRSIWARKRGARWSGCRR